MKETRCGTCKVRRNHYGGALQHLQFENHISYDQLLEFQLEDADFL